MSRIKSFFFTAFLLSVSLFYFSACSEKGEVNSPNQMNFESPQFAVLDFSDVLNGVEDATLENEMTFSNSLFSYSFMNNPSGMTPGNPGMRGNPWMERFDFGKHLGLFFRGMNLTEEQRISIKELMAGFHESLKPLVKEFRDSNAEIIIKANADRKVIADQVKAGTLTRQEAGVLIKELNEATRESIKNNPKSLEIKAQMCESKALLFEEIAKLLTVDQLTKWNERILRIPDPCR